MRHEDQIPSKALLLEAYDPIIGINIANMCVGAIGICLNILVITAFSKLAPSARKKSVNILLFQQAFVDLFGSIFYSVGRYALILHRDQTLVQQVRDTGITAYDTCDILRGILKEPNATVTSKAVFLNNLNMIVSSSKFFINSSTVSHQLMITYINLTSVAAVLTTMLNFLTIATDQWLAINHPFYHHINVTVMKTVIACAFVWLFSIFVAVFLSLISYCLLIEKNWPEFMLFLSHLVL